MGDTSQETLSLMFVTTLSSAWPQGYKTFFMLHSTEHEISTAHEN